MIGIQHTDGSVRLNPPANTVFQQGEKVIGITEDDLIRWDEQVEASGALSYDGETWEFQSSGEVICFDAGGVRCDSYYGWDFVGKSQQRLLCVEKRENAPFEVCFVHMIDVDRVQVTRG